jgi:hypothetical protein
VVVCEEFPFAIQASCLYTANEITFGDRHMFSTRIRFAFIFVLFLSLCFPAIVLAKKCTRAIPKDIFKYYGEKKKKDIDCDRYFHKKIDLDQDGKDEFIVANYRKCHSRDSCSYDLFRKTDGDWVHIGRTAGRPEPVKTRSNGFSDLACWSYGHRYLYCWTGKNYKDYSLFGNRQEIDIRNEKSEDPDKTQPIPAR